MKKKLISVLTVLSLLATILNFGFAASAKTVKKGIVTVGTISAVVGDTVIVPVSISENPGIMAITISITYDSSVLEYVRFFRGTVVKDYTVAAHPDKNLIRFVNCESSDKTNDGELINLQFKIKDNAMAELYPISVSYSAGDFCNYELDKIMPEVVSGGIEVAFNGSNCTHKKYGEWTVAAEPSCEDCGAEQRICKTCGHIELRDTDPIGHEYSNKWTIDRPATKEQDGMMTRYCIRCDDYVDRISFSLENANEGGFKNEITNEVPVNEFTESLFKEQYPDSQLTDFKPSKNTADSSENKTQSSAQGAVSDIDSDSENLDGEKTDNNTSDEPLSGAKSELTDKIAEVFPDYNLILRAFKIALAVLVALIM